MFLVGNDFQWSGTIVAPNAEVVVGQSGKNFYGAIYAKSIVIHQNTKVTWVPFRENSSNSVPARIGNDVMSDYTISFLAE